MDQSKRIGVIDIGSNGIRMSVHLLDDNNHLLTKNGWTLHRNFAFQRLSISLMKEMTQDKTIPESTIDQVTAGISHFCRENKLKSENVQIIATESLRVAKNNQTLVTAIEKSTGVKLKILSKAEESNLGIAGACLTLHMPIHGFLVDLGGGSIQINWISSKDGQVKFGKNPQSLPFGAEAMTQRLESERPEVLMQEMILEFQKSLQELDIQTENHTDLVLIGGGSRSYGYILQHLYEDPGFSINRFTNVNGFKVKADIFRLLVSQLFNLHFQVNNSIKSYQDSYLFPNIHSLDLKNVHGLSKRKQIQIPATLLVFNAFISTIPSSKNIIFSEGGTREGLLCAYVDSKDLRINPIHAAFDSTFSNYKARFEQVQVFKVSNFFPSTAPLTCKQYFHVVLSVIDSSYFKGLSPSEQCNRALELMSSGLLSGIVGGSQQDLGFISLALRHSFKKHLPDKRFQNYLKSVIVGAELACWAKYLGRLCKWLNNWPNVGQNTSIIDKDSIWILEIKLKKNYMDSEQMHSLKDSLNKKIKVKDVFGAVLFKLKPNAEIQTI